MAAQDSGSRTQRATWQRPCLIMIAALLACGHVASAATVTWTMGTGKTGWGQTAGTGDGTSANGFNNWSGSSPDPYPVGSGTLPGATDDYVFDSKPGLDGTHNTTEIWLRGNYGYVNASGTGRFTNSMTFRGLYPKTFSSWSSGSQLPSNGNLYVTNGIVMEADSGPLTFGQTYTQMFGLVVVGVGTTSFIRNDSASPLQLGPAGNASQADNSVTLQPSLAALGTTMILPISGTGTGGLDVYTRIGNAGTGTAARYLGLDINLPNAAVRFYWPNTYSGATTITAGTLALGTNSLYPDDPTGFGIGTVNSSSLIVKQGGVFDAREIPQGYVVPGKQTLAGDGLVRGAVTIGGTARLSPGISVGTLSTTGSVTLGSLGNYNWQIADAAGTAGGTGWDLLTTSGVIDVQATSAAPFAINLWSLSGTNPTVNGNAAHFDSGRNYTWRIAQAGGGITNFSADKFVIVSGSTSLGTGGFANSLAGGTFSIAQDGNTLNLVFTSTAGPTPTVITIHVPSGVQTQTQAGYPLLTGTVPVLKTGAGTLVIDQPNTLTGSTTVQAGRLQLAAASALAASRLVPLAGGTVTLAPGLQTTVGGLAPLIGGLTDVGNGMVTVAAGLSAADMVTALLTGLGDGSWNGGSGITSSVAAASGGSRTVGWLDNGDGSVTFAFAAAGDTNLDWQVDILDSANFLSSGKLDSGLPATWIEGDFTYDGFVDVLDAAAFLSTGLLDAGPYNGAGAAGVAAVPEPSTAIGLGGAAVAMVARRRPRRRG